MTIRFDQPDWLWALAVIVPMGAVMLRWCLSMSALRRWSAVTLRAVLVGLIVAMLAGVSMVRKTEKLAVLGVIDVSGSVRSFAPPVRTPEGALVPVTERARQWLRVASGRRGPEDLLGLIAFDGGAVLLAPPSPADVLDRSLDVRLAEGTDLAAAIRLGLAAFPADAARRIVIFTDGVATRGDAIEAAREAAGAAGHGVPAGAPDRVAIDAIPIDVVPIRYDVKREVLVETVDAPTRATAGSTVTVRVTLRATHPAAGVLRLYYEDQEVDAAQGNGAAGLGRRVSLKEGANFFAIEVPLSSERVHRFRALFEPGGGAEESGDTIASNNSAEAVTVTPGRGAVLLVDGVSNGAPAGPGGLLARTLRQEGIDVDQVAPDAVPSDMLRLQAYDLVILQNVAADVLGDAHQERLASYVTELGGGLVMVGGPDSFAAGGYRGSVLEPILPVKLELPDRLIVPATAVVIVLDTSGSMGFRVMGSSRSQQEIANEGAAMAVRSLDKTDLAGVIEFNSGYRVVVPLARNTDPEATAKRILDLDPNGGTDMIPAIQEAQRQLRQADAKVKHIIALTDGVSRNRGSPTALARALADDGIKLSTIAVGDGADTEGLAMMAQANGGQYYRVTDPNTLPRIFLRAIRVVRTPMIRETPFTPVIVDPASPLLDASLASGAPPQLLGLALTQPRSERTVFYPMMTDGGEPVLAHWQAGLGQVAAFTSDAHDRWAKEWVDWPGYRAMWTRIVRQISRPGGQRAAELTAHVEGDRLRLRMDASAEDGRPLDGLVAPATIYAPDGTRSEVRLSQTGPGQYEGEARVEDGGNYVVTIAPRDGGRALAPVIGGLSKAAGPEYRSLRSDEGVLEQIAAITGGRVLELDAPEQAQLFDRSSVRPREARTPLWPLLLPWVLVLALLDVAARRLAWDRLISAQFGEGLRKHAARMVRDRGEQAASTIGQLREVEAEVDARRGEFQGARLGAADARKLVEQRRRERIARGSGSPPQPVPRPVPTEPAAPDTLVPPQDGGLAAAKRRAKERFDPDG